MFTGHIQELGRVDGFDGELVGVRAPRSAALIEAGGSVCVAGVRLTVLGVRGEVLEATVAEETRRRSTFDVLSTGDRVNVELPLTAGQPLDGHLVQGYVDGVGKVARVEQEDGCLRVWIRPPERLLAGGVAVWDPVAENEGDVIFAGAALRPAAFRFLLTEVCGHPTVPCAGPVLDRLDIGPIPGAGDRQGTAFQIPVDLASGTGTGVSAAERAAVVRRLANPCSVPGDFLRPGHVYPLRARPGLLAERQGHTEATVALCVAAGLAPVGVCCEVMNQDGTMAGPADLEVAALRWGHGGPGVARCPRFEISPPGGHGCW